MNANSKLEGHSVAEPQAKPKPTTETRSYTEKAKVRILTTEDTEEKRRTSFGSQAHLEDRLRRQKNNVKQVMKTQSHRPSAYTSRAGYDAETLRKAKSNTHSITEDTEEKRRASFGFSLQQCRQAFFCVAHCAGQA